MIKIKSKVPVKAREKEVIDQIKMLAFPNIV